MFDKSHFLGKYIMITVVALLTLTLFDSNPWWKVLLYAIPATLLNLYLTGMAIQRSLPARLAAPLQGVAAALVAYLVGITPFFRTTLGTLVGFSLLLSLGEFLLMGFFPQQNVKS